jgi:hypothetical protein
LGDNGEDEEMQIARDEHELERLEQEATTVVTSVHEGFADASRERSLEEAIRDLDTQIRHEREKQKGISI